MRRLNSDGRRFPLTHKVGVFIAMLLIAVALGRGLGEASPSDPTDTVHRFYDALLNTMQNGPSLGDRGRYDRLAPVIGQSFDVPYMAQRAVGAGWTKLTSPQRQAVTEAFQRYMTATYAGRFDSYSGEKFQVRGVEPTSFGTIVQSQIVKSDGAPVSINYLMHENSGAWQIADVYLTGTISQLANLRSQFSAVLTRQGVDGLIAMLNEKAETLVANNKS
ncbi:MAG TPA: ABC transporter substrate-binding protein [Stellaceae bacterium]|nr:ABC transporter substrate-binding protein [Stellaceae bacterium]